MPDPDPAGMILFNIVLPLVSIFILLLLTALFSLCDEAFFAIGETRVREMEEDGNRKAGKIRRLTEKERQFTSRIRMSVLFCTVIGVMRFVNLTGFLANLLLPLLGGVMGFTFTAIIAYILLFLFAFVLFGTFGFLLPRRLAHLDPESISLKLVDIFSFFHALLYPLYGACRLISWPFIRMAGMDPKEDPDTVTEDDIIELIEDVEEIGALEESQKDMLNNIFAFDDITAAEIMTPRPDMVAVEVNDTIAEVLATSVENGYSRLPVYEEDVDHVLGILYIKDLLPYVGRAIPKSVTVRKLLRKTLFVPDTKKCDELFEELCEQHLQMAIIVDEYGGVAGIVTIEDLLESIVGNMQDEFDNEEEEITQLDEDSFEIDAALSIGELNELLDIELPEGDYDTVAGFILDQLGHIPEDEEEAVAVFENVTFTVLEMEDRRIEQVLVRRTPLENNQEDED